MISENRLSAHFKKRETALIWWAMSFAYTMLFAFLEDPKHVTISLIGKERLFLFCIYCFLYGSAFLINIFYMYRTYKVGNKVLLKIACVSNLCMGLVATTLMPYKAGGSEISTFATIVHWIAGFGNIIINATVVLVFCLTLGKQLKNKKLKAVAIVGAVVSLAVLLSFVIMTIVFKDPQKSKNGFLEIVPIAVAFIAMYFINHTDLAIPRAERDAEEIHLTVKDNSIFSAVCWGSLVFTCILFSTYIFIRNPIHYTISMTALEYNPGFVIVCLAMAFTLCCNFIMMFKKHHCKNYFTIAVALVGSLAIIPCIAAPTTESADINPIHSLSAIVFFYFIMAAVIFFLIPASKKNKKYKPFLAGMIAIFAITLIVTVLLFIVFQQKYGRTGLVELLPLEYIFIFFILENHSGYFKENAEKESELVKAK
ncbi:MAG: hypothetical protein NC122_09700 [Faecalibacterium sp.]|nr:hypothetical protein [Ruminococcus sp.]MCM1392908.1 hypothetical protein [Ruminococcus sp.]MCM1486464.1 hypothetical protein [Faecalibacterium sp.]